MPPHHDDNGADSQAEDITSDTPFILPGLCFAAISGGIVGAVTTAFACGCLL